ncbi:MAG: 2-amino-4-hydroxy-6-hydroxymethyldihydropteridine diphosphokinase [Candidatus Hydrogenedentes bacterium CG1_02_42_14]|nr:MAG: 2-amino-4-hydroxy-6-hydroxymethyldihydropteridine diphosphokinase [Candidatus Hydrogenedentes bacterium CG1_02_42_14]
MKNDNKLIAWISLGSNLGERLSYIKYGLKQLDEIFTDSKHSKIIETSALNAEGNLTPQPSYLNAVCCGIFYDKPEALLKKLNNIETSAGRNSMEKGKYMPRTLDLDILIIEKNGNLLITDTNELVLPHPRLLQRKFLLELLSELGFNLLRLEKKR